MNKKAKDTDIDHLHSTTITGGETLNIALSRPSFL